jgi:fatty acid desaturase
MSVRTVRQQFMKEFQGLAAYTRGVSLTIVGSYIAQIVVAIGLGYWLLQSPVTFPTGLGVAALMFFIGTRLRGLNNIVHECCHFAFAQRRDDNVLFGSLCASVILGCFRTYREEHLTHHAHLGDYDKDLDLQGIRKFRLEEPLTPKTILRHVMTPLLGLHLPYYVSVDLSARDGKPYRYMKIGLIAAATVFLVLDPVPALLMVWLPFLWIFPAINYWTDCVDHAGIVRLEDEFDSSRNIPLPKHLRAFLFPRNDCYHLVHHLFPQVPAHHLEACHRQLLADPEYRARAKGERSQGSFGMTRTVG